MVISGIAILVFSVAIRNWHAEKNAEPTTHNDTVTPGERGLGILMEIKIQAIFSLKKSLAIVDTGHRGLRAYHGRDFGCRHRQRTLLIQRRQRKSQ